MPFVKRLFDTIFRKHNHAKSFSDTANVRGKLDGGLFHILPATREQALADLRRIGMLEAALATEPLRTGEYGEGVALRQAHTRLIRAAKNSGDFIPAQEIPSFGNRKQRQSGESVVYFDTARNLYTKIKNPAAKAAIKHTTPNDWPYEHIIHNILFPFSRYDFLGVTEQNGEARIVLRQVAIDAETRASSSQVKRAMISLGLNPEDRFFFGNSLVAVTDVGQGGDNALVADDGRIAFIDPLIRLKHPAKTILDALLA